MNAIVFSLLITRPHVTDQETHPSMSALKMTSRGVRTEASAIRSANAPFEVGISLERMTHTDMSEPRFTDKDDFHKGSPV